jgi:LEA14-like dessication related protein
LQVACAASLFVAIGCSGLPFGNGIEVPDVQIADVMPVEGPGLVPRARVDLTLTNPNNVPLEINGMRLQLDFNDLRLAVGQTDQVVTLPRLGEASMSIVLTSSLTDLLRQFSELRRPGLFRRLLLRRSIEYEIRGDIFLQAPENRTLHFRSSSS